jgi:WD40 repeat protein
MEIGMIKKITFILYSILIFSSPSMAREHPYFVDEVDVSPNGRYIAIGRLDYKIILYDLEEKKVVKAFSGGPGNEINNDTFFTPDNKYWVIQDRSLILRFWDIEKQVITKEVELESEANGLIFFKDGKRMIWGGADGRIEFVNLETDERKLLKKPNPYESWEREISDLILSADETRFVSVTRVNSYDESFEEPEDDFGLAWEGSKHTLVKHNGINLWDANTFTKIKKLQAKDASGRAWATFSPDSKYVFTSYESSRGGLVRQWDTNSGDLVKVFSRADGEAVCILDPRGDYLVCLWHYTPSKNITLYRTSEAKNIKDIQLKYEYVTGQMATIPSKNLIIIGDTDGSISVYKFDPEKLDIELIWHPEPVKSGIITWISPLKFIDKTEAEARKMQQNYIEQQKKMGYGDDVQAKPTEKKDSQDTSKDSSYPGVSFGPGVSLNN